MTDKKEFLTVTLPIIFAITAAAFGVVLMNKSDIGNIKADINKFEDRMTALDTKFEARMEKIDERWVTLLSEIHRLDKDVTILKAKN